MVQDYRTLNTITIKNKYPLSLISKVVIKLQGAHYFTKLDIHWGFNNVHIKPGDEWKVALCTNCGLFKPLVMFFSMTNSPVTFQTRMNNIFWDLIAEGIMIVYLDIILTFTQTLKEYYRVVCRVMEVLAKHKLFLCPEKCDFYLTPSMRKQPSPKCRKVGCTSLWHPCIPMLCCKYLQDPSG